MKSILTTISSLAVSNAAMTVAPTYAPDGSIYALSRVDSSGKTYVDEF